MNGRALAATEYGSAAAVLPNAEFRILPNTAHLPMLEQPSVIADEIAALCARVRWGG